MSQFVTRAFRCVKYARIRVFPDPYFTIYGQNLQFCLCTEICGFEKTVSLKQISKIDYHNQIYGLSSIIKFLLADEKSMK